MDRNARLVTSIAGIAAVIGLAGCSATGGAPTAAPTTVTTVSAGSPVTPRAPEPADFRVDVIVTDKQCFGPANCIYHYTIDPWPTSTYPPETVASKLIVLYSVTGGDQDQIGNFTIDEAGGVHRDTNVTVIGPDGATFVATVTRVIVEDS